MNNQAENNHERGYTAAVVIFIVGIIALAAAMIFGLKNINVKLLICEGVALICLIGLLVVSVKAKRSAARQSEERRRNPYSSVDKKEIDKVLDMIVEEEKKRKRLDAFAAGKDIREESSAAVNDVLEEELDYEDKDKKESSVSNEDADDDDSMLIIFDDDEELNINPNKENSNDEDSQEREEESEMSGNSHDDYNERPPRRRPAEGADRRERDPYYDDYYGDRPRPRERDPYASRTYYNEYGEPVRRRRQPAYDPYYDDYYGDRPRSRDPRARDPRARDPYAARTYYNEYGEPIRRRPLPPEDGRYPQSRRRRPPEGYPENARQRMEEERRRPDTLLKEAENSEDIRTAAPVQMNVPSSREYDDDYVPVVIPEDDYEAEAERGHGRAGVGSYRGAAQSTTAHSQNTRAQYNSYDDDDDDERMPVALADEEEYARRYQDDTPPPPRSAHREDMSAANAPHTESREEKYVPSYEEEEGVVSLPRDEEYDAYMEEKIAEERKAERLAQRKASGKIVLTIAKLRSRKIRRKSRKYRNFRASVHHLADYLNSYSVKTSHK